MGGRSIHMISRARLPCRARARAVPNADFWHLAEVSPEGRHDRYRGQSRLVGDAAESAARDPKRSCGPIDSQKGRQYNLLICVF